MPSCFEAELNKFTSEDILVSTMPRAAVDIAAESVCNSTRKKYNNMFKKFVSYGHSVGKNILLYNFNAVLVIGFFLLLYTSKGSIGSILLARAAIH